MALVQLAVTPLGGIPGATAYHSSILVDGEEFSFGNAGIARYTGPVSHQALDRVPDIIEVGTTSRSVAHFMAGLSVHFRQGTYDVLYKNCNTFTDVALYYFVQQRLGSEYRTLEQVGAGVPLLFRLLTGGRYVPNPEAQDFDAEALIRNLEPRSARRAGHSIWSTDTSAAEEKKDSRAETTSSFDTAMEEDRGVLLLPLESDDIWAQPEEEEEALEQALEKAALEKEALEKPIPALEKPIPSPEMPIVCPARPERSISSMDEELARMLQAQEDVEILGFLAGAYSKAQGFAVLPPQVPPQAEQPVCDGVRPPMQPAQQQQQQPPAFGVLPAELLAARRGQGCFLGQVEAAVRRFEREAPMDVRAHREGGTETKGTAAGEGAGAPEIAAVISGAISGIAHSFFACGLVSSAAGPPPSESIGVPGWSAERPDGITQ